MNSAEELPHRPAEGEQPGGPYKKTAADRRAAVEITRALYWSADVPRGKVSARVENNRVILEGEVFWHYERRAALDAVSVDGVDGISDDIRVISEAGDGELKNNIRKAFAGSELIDERTIVVKVNRSRVTLTGRANTKSRKDEAGRISLEEKGVRSVDNRILVRCVDGRGRLCFFPL